MNTVFGFFYFFLCFGLKKFHVNGFDDINSIEITKRRLSTYDKWESNKISESDDIRCFCNLPQCVSTGYMCRTARSGNGSGCFSEIREEPNQDRSATRHGCVELLKNLDQLMQCNNSPRKYGSSTGSAGNNLKAPSASASAVVVVSTSQSSTETLLLCCQEDMCNHVDNPENQHKILKTDMIDNTEISNPGRLSITDDEIENRLNVPMLPSPGVSSNEDWFRVATIAVPICGAVILFSLIAVAIKILRSERITSPSSKLDSVNELGVGGGGGSIGGHRKFPSSVATNSLNLADHEAQTMKRSSPHLCRYANSNNYHHNNHHYALATSDINCDKKNETRAKINQLINLEYSLLPQSDRESAASLLLITKPSNIEPSVSNLLYTRNVNISLDSANRNNKDIPDKIYEKEVLSPVTAANWQNGNIGGNNNNNNCNGSNNINNNNNNYKNVDI